jgi:hypothetical protein
LLLNTGWSGVASVPSPVGDRMAVVFGRVFLWVGELSGSRLSSLLVGVSN